MTGDEILLESALNELTKRLPSLKKHDYDTLDVIMGQVANRHKISRLALSDIFKDKYDTDPDTWIRGKLDEESLVDVTVKEEVDKFVQWCSKRIKLESIPEIELSMDTEEAQGNHHTGGHVPGSGKIWVYANNRNLVDILRTVAHELTHVKQHELGKIKPNSSYPGSPIELVADMVAGTLMKIYGKDNNQIFQ